MLMKIHSCESFSPFAVASPKLISFFFFRCRQRLQRATLLRPPFPPQDRSRAREGPRGPPRRSLDRSRRGEEGRGCARGGAISTPRRSSRSRYSRPSDTPPRKGQPSLIGGPPSTSPLCLRCRPILPLSSLAHHVQPHLLELLSTSRTRHCPSNRAQTQHPYLPALTPDRGPRQEHRRDATRTDEFGHEAGRLAGERLAVEFFGLSPVSDAVL